MCDIHGYIRSLTPPISRDAVYRELVKQDASITRGDITKALKDLGYTVKTRKVQGGCGVAHLWMPSRQEPEQEPEPEQDEPKERTTEDVVSDVEARNAANIEMNRRLLETLQISRNLKQEMMEKQVDALVSMARMILAIHGTDDEKRRYFVH